MALTLTIYFTGAFLGMALGSILTIKMERRAARAAQLEYHKMRLMR